MSNTIQSAVIADKITVKQLGSQGPRGYAGWTPIIIQFADGNRMLNKLTGYEGGEGPLPPTLAARVGKYQKLDGTWTSDASLAFDINSGSAANAALATTKANAATAFASTAANHAASAAGSANTASTKSDEAFTSASNAATANSAAQIAKSSAETAATSANTANTNAQTAKNLAQTSAENATNANTDAQTAKTAAESASTNATTKSNAANAYAITAGNNAANAAGSANTASTKADEAVISANNAAAANATAQTAKTAAETAATTATTKAAEALNSANQSAASAASSSAVALGVSTGRNSIAPTILLDFANTQQLDSRLTFSRGSAATYFDRTGVLRTAPANVARFGFDPENGESLGLLIEESRTNIVKVSDATSGAFWDNFPDCDVSFNSQISIKGAQTACRVSKRAQSGYSFFRQFFANLSGIFTISVFVKKVNNRFVGIRLGSRTDFPNNATHLVYDFDTNSFSNKGTWYSYVKSENLANGWVRIIATANIGSNIVSLVAGISVSNANGNESWNSTSNGILSVDFCGMQLEQGGFPTSYITTASTAVTREADVCYFSASLNSNINFNEGTFLAEVGPTKSSFARIIGTNSNTGFIGISNNPYVEFFDAVETIYSGGLSNPKLIVAAFFGNTKKIIADNNNAITVSNSYNKQSNLIIYIGSAGGSSNHYNSTIKKVAYYSKCLSDTELRELTTKKLAGNSPNQLPSGGDLGGAAFMQLRSLLGMKARSEVNYHGTGAQVSYTIRRPYAFSLAIVNSNGSTTTTLPTANADGSYTADTNYTLLHNAPAGTALTLEIIPILY